MMTSFSPQTVVGLEAELQTSPRVCQFRQRQDFDLPAEDWGEAVGAFPREHPGMVHQGSAVEADRDQALIPLGHQEGGVRRAGRQSVHP